MERRRFVRFLAVGLVNTAFGYAVYAAGLYIGTTPSVALLIATVAGVLFNFFTTGRLVFANAGTQRLPRFIMAYCVTYCINLCLLTGLLRLGLGGLAAQALSLPIVVMCSFAILRIFVFAEGEAER